MIFAKINHDLKQKEIMAFIVECNFLGIETKVLKNQGQRNTHKKIDAIAQKGIRIVYRIVAINKKANKVDILPCSPLF